MAIETILVRHGQTVRNPHGVLQVRVAARCLDLQDTEYDLPQPTFENGPPVARVGVRLDCANPVGSLGLVLVSLYPRRCWLARVDCA